MMLKKLEMSFKTLKGKWMKHIFIQQTFIENVWVTDLILDAALISSKNFHSCAVYDQGYCGQLRNNGILKYT